MTSKEMLLEAVRQLPDDITLREALEELAVLAAIERAQASALVEVLVDHDELMRQAALWTAK